eukprot:207280-Alexandrium_andersonii.AAC.1
MLSVGAAPPRIWCQTLVVGRASGGWNDAQPRRTCAPPPHDMFVGAVQLGFSRRGGSATVADLHCVNRG